MVCVRRCCGFCKQCESAALTNYYPRRLRPRPPEYAYGFAMRRPERQAGRLFTVRGPTAGRGDAEERQADYVMLAVYLPHRRHRDGGLTRDQTVIRCGSAGLMAAYSAPVIKGCWGRVWVCDASTPIGCARAIADRYASRTGEVIHESRGAQRRQRGCECIGYQAHGQIPGGDASRTMNSRKETSRFTRVHQRGGRVRPRRLERQEARPQISDFEAGGKGAHRLWGRKL